NDSVEVVHCAARKYQLIGFAMPDDHLAAAFAEASEVGIIRSDDVMELALRLVKIRFETGLRYRSPIEFRILVYPILEMLGRYREGIGSGQEVQRRPSLEAEPQPLAIF